MLLLLLHKGVRCFFFFLCTAFWLETGLVSMLNVLRMGIKTIYMSHWLLKIPNDGATYTFVDF